MNKVIVIVGPTGVGKTKLGVSLAKVFNGEVISGDSMQIYKTMDIGTAKVTKEESEGIVHHLIDIREPDENYSVASFQKDVRFLIDDISSRDKLPIIVGGTGLYIKAALYDYKFKETSIDNEFYIKKYQDKTNEELYALLESIDPKSAEETHPNNRQRVTRAIAIYESTGKTKSETIASQKQECLYDTIFIGLTLERELLYQRINQRVDIMIDNGLLDEVTRLINQGCHRDCQSMKAIGYREWFGYFDKESSLEETVELIKQHSRNYAKRQYTWFKNQMTINWFNVDLDNFNNTVEDVKKMIQID